MKKSIYFTIFLLFGLYSTAISQGVIEKTICLNVNEIYPNGYNVFSDDVPCQSGLFPTLTTMDECYFQQEKTLFLSSGESCCDTFQIEYFYQQDPMDDIYMLTLIIKCDDPVPKPNCTNIYLSPPDESTPGGDPTQGEKITYYACDSTPVTYFVDDVPGQMITWTTGGIPFTSPATNMINIVWPGPGSYTIEVTVGGITTEYCIEILESPDADFSFSGSCGCLNTPISFMSTGIGGNKFYWDFGDGMIDYGANVTHQYSAPGFYNVTLVVVQDNFDDKMNPLCCCSDTISMPIEILNLEGPPIYWISTLCEGDSTKYWTDAVGCTYSWTAVDSDGMNVLPSGTVITNDTLCVPWGNGPFGVVGLTVTGCTPDIYCPKPTTAVIPIIQAVSTISGKDTVCIPSNEFYSVPKWPTVEYTWEIIPASAGTISGSGNAISINWNGSSSSATIIVNYHSDFLGGIVGHEQEDCAGYAKLDVTILPRFEIKTPKKSVFCLGDTLNFTAGPKLPSTVYPLFFIWKVNPPSGPSTLASVPGTSGYNYIFNTVGTYTIVVYPYPNPYCMDSIVKKINIIEVPPMDAIDGPKEVCQGDTVTYFGSSSIPSTEFHWTASGGTIFGSSTGNPITVTWNTPGPYIIGAYQKQINEPKCASDTIFCTIIRKTLGTGYTITGPSACVNEIMTYGITPVPPDPDVTYSWEIMGNLNGSVVSGDTGPVVDIQWNNTTGVDTIFCTIALCSDTIVVTKIVNINQAAAVTITQNMPFCIGAIGVNLTASTAGASYSWITPPPTPANTTSQSVNVNAPGNYVVTVTETNGCTAVANYEVFENGLPNVNLTSPDFLDLCIQDVGNTVDLHALVGSYSYQWYKSSNGGAFSLDPELSAILTHTNTGVVGYCHYYYIATDLSSGCSDQSNTLLVRQNDCTGGPGCTPASYSTNVTNSPAYPNCDVINFTTTNSINVTVTSWDFKDPILGNGAYTGPITAPTFNYSKAGYYVATMYGTVPNQANSALCTISDTTLVCVPLVADFDFTYNCGVYTFTSTSSWITGAAPTSYSWDFGDTNSGITNTATHMYTVTVPTVFTVKLTIMNPDGCISMYSENITVLPPPTANIVVMPSDTCVEKPFMFSNNDNTGIVGWNWAFGDMSTNGGSDPKHAYSVAGTYMVTLTVTDENGCTNSDVETVIVHPAATPGPITYAGDLFLCFGESMGLNAPAGASYIWTTGATTPTITVSTTDTYGVTVTDINGCTFIPDSVDVVVYPQVDATITGSNIICDEGCTKLYAVSAAGYSYQWDDDFGPLTPNPGGTSVDICYNSVNTTTMVTLTVTDANMCTATQSVNINYYTSPDVLITPSNPILCEGTPDTLTASTTFPNPVTYSWSTGQSGPSIIVILEGTYEVTVTDPVSGCSRDTFINVNPLPDLCIVPYGCYTACDPDTICGPPGLDDYQWYFQGVLQPMYSGLECIIVTESGAYNFAGTNEFNCTAYSDTLYLEMIPCCRPGDTEISATLPAGEEDCCYSFNYTLNQDIFYYLDLHSGDADLGLNLGSVNPLLSVGSSLPTLNSFKSNPSGNSLPQGPLTGFATICLENVTSNPVEVIADWRGEDGEILCSDTLLLECIVEPDCIYVQNDSIYCDPATGILVYDVTICNPVDAAYDISYIDFLELTPPGVLLNPSEIDLGTSPLMPGDCINLTFGIMGSNLANQTLCYNLVGHQYNPNEDPGTLCCSADTTYCVFMPGCTPCDMVYVSGIDSSSMGECCYDITVNNYYDDMSFSGIDLCVLTAGATFDIFNPILSPWDVLTLTTTTATLDYKDGAITHIPFGDTSLPTICVGDNVTPYVDVEIKWMSGGVIFCRDTISLLCSDCGYMSETSLVCGPNGTWIFTGYITNTSLDTMDSAYIDFGDDLLNAYDTQINLNGLAPQQTYGPFSITLSGTTGVGPELCIITTLHANDHDQNHEDCCEFKTIIEVPDCVDPVDCLCGPEFENQVALGMNCDQVGSSLTYNFSPVGNFGDCDKVIWEWKDEQVESMTTGNQVISHTFPNPGEFTVCMKITRIQSNGKKCKEKFCKDVLVGIEGFVNAFPNPVTNQVNLVLKEIPFEGMASIEIIDANNRKCMSINAEMGEQIITSIDVSDIQTGVYMIRINMDNKIHTKRILIVR